MARYRAAIIPKQGVAQAIAQALDAPQLRELVAGLEERRTSRRGRPGYGTRALLGACLVKSLYGLPTWAAVARLIGDHPGLQDTLGGAPSKFACYRFAAKLHRHRDLIESCTKDLIETLGEQQPGLGKDVSIDSTDLPAYANGQKYRYKGGPEREAFSDPNATWGHRSAVSTRKGGGFYGYKLHMATCSKTGLPLAWQVQTGKEADMRQVETLLNQLVRRGIRPRTAAMDKGYDYKDVYARCASYGVLPIVSKRSNSGTGACLRALFRSL